MLGNNKKYINKSPAWKLKICLGPLFLFIFPGPRSFFAAMIKAEFQWPKPSAKTSRPTNTYALSSPPNPNPNSNPIRNGNRNRSRTRTRTRMRFGHVWEAVAAATTVGIMQAQYQFSTSCRGITVITISKLPPTASGRANKQFQQTI